MKRYNFKNKYGGFTVAEIESGRFIVYGSRKAAAAAFKAINRKPPNKYGNFYGREKAGFAACRELIAAQT